MKIDDYSYPLEDYDLTDIRPAKPPFGYYGAKQRIAHQIIEMLPKHNAWVEGFCGSAALTLAKSPAPIEIINDLDDEIINLFKQLRENPEPLYRAIVLTPYARAEHSNAKEPQDGLDELERARRFLVTTMMTVNGTNGCSQCGFSYSQSYARTNREARVNRWYNLPERLERVVERFRNVRVEKKDARELVTMFSDRPATLMYLDPPYFVKREHGYVIDANDRDFHTQLLEVCLKAKCMLLISAYESNLYETMLKKEDGWVSQKIQTYTSDTTGVNYAKTEVLWMNSYFVEARAKNEVPIQLTAKELKEKKLNPAR